MHAFDILGDPVRRRILELLADGQLPAGQIAATIGTEFGISQPAVSQHLRVLRDNGFATVTVDGTRRLYAVDTEPLREIDAWLDRYRKFWTNRLDALDTELRRGRRAAASPASSSPASSPKSSSPVSPSPSTSPSKALDA
jgi:DNA-binding transcriptional ArsR family regulator